MTDYTAELERMDATIAKLKEAIEALTRPIGDPTFPSYESIMVMDHIKVVIERALHARNYINSGVYDEMETDHEN